MSNVTSCIIFALLFSFDVSMAGVGVNMNRPKIKENIHMKCYTEVLISERTTCSGLARFVECIFGLIPGSDGFTFPSVEGDNGTSFSINELIEDSCESMLRKHSLINLDNSCDLVRHWFFASLITTLMWWMVIVLCLVLVFKLRNMEGSNVSVSYWSPGSSSQLPETTQKDGAEASSSSSKIITSSATATSQMPKGPWEPRFGAFFGRIFAQFPPPITKTAS